MIRIDFARPIVTCAAIFMATHGAYAQTPRYRVEVIGSSESNTSANGLNNLGQVVGSRQYGDDQGAFLYSRGEITRLIVPGTLSHAMDINDRGDIVGHASSPSHQQYSFVYRNGQVTDITATLERGGNLPWSINEAGHVSGVFNDKGFFYDGTRSRPITHPELHRDMPFSVVGLNDHDAVVGWTHGTPQGEGQFAFIYQDGELTRIPGFSPAGPIDAIAINNAGDVVGGAFVSGQGIMPYLYSNGAMKNLGNLGGLPSEGQGTYANAINEQGWIVGSSYTAASELAAFLYKDGQMLNLNDLLVPAAAGQWNIGSSNDINDKGQILAYAFNERDKLNYSLLLTPVPEPQAWFSLLAGLGVMSMVVRRRRNKSSATPEMPANRRSVATPR